MCPARRLLNLYKDVGDLEWAFAKRGPRAPRDTGVAFFKTTGGNTDAIASHATWGYYGAMNKVLKKYVFSYSLLAGSGQPVPATTVTFSGYPGSVSSGDDFYLTNMNLASTLGTSFPGSYCFDEAISRTGGNDDFTQIIQRWCGAQANKKCNT
ncbi:hypothetical protein V5799_007418 [Amblyomma americanum]|uniref:Phospholipase B-like n=1 Tax=Amblyomma americanum TaxID=6943 RepID=A0AAQ4FFX4_AMBAM